MNQNEFGNLIKEIRKKYNLTQKELAEKYHVTYQAVSKWENGKNMPDVSLIKEISKDFNVSIDDMLEGKYNKKKKMYVKIIFLILIFTTIIFLGIVLLNRESNFEFKTLSSNCSNFNISGSISYNKKKSAIYVTNIEYCGEEDNTLYKKISCTLYESVNGTNKKISSYEYEDNITLEEFLKNVTLSVDNYDKICRVYNDNSLYLEIECTNSSEVMTTYKVPLSMKSNCGGN